MRQLFAVTATMALLLTACEAKIGKDDNAAAGNDSQASEVSAEGKAKEGQFSIKAPGFDLRFTIPRGIASHAEVDSESNILYPGATLSGMHVEAGKEEPTGARHGAVELRFTSGEAPDTIAAWYADPARADDIKISSSTREGAAYVIEGQEKRDGDAFTVRLEPRNGGTDGRLTLRDKG